MRDVKMIRLADDLVLLAKDDMLDTLVKTGKIIEFKSIVLILQKYQLC